jgi:hypothetical protein
MSAPGGCLCVRAGATCTDRGSLDRFKELDHSEAQSFG